MSFQAKLKSAVHTLKAREQHARDNPQAVPQTVPLHGDHRPLPVREPLWGDMDWDALLAKLPAKLRPVVELRFREGLSLSQAALRLGCCKSAVEKWEKLATALLRPVVARMVGREG